MSVYLQLDSLFLSMNAWSSLTDFVLSGCTSFIPVSPFASFPGLLKRRKSQETPVLSPEPNKCFKIKAQRVAFDAEDLTRVIIGVMRRRGPSFLLFFGFLVCAIFIIYKNLGSSMQGTLTTTVCSTQLPGQEASVLVATLEKAADAPAVFLLRFQATSL